MRGIYQALALLICFAPDEGAGGGGADDAAAKAAAEAKTAADAKAVSDAAAKAATDAAAAAAATSGSGDGAATDGTAKTGEPSSTAAVTAKAPEAFTLTLPAGEWLSDQDVTEFRTFAKEYGWTEEQTQANLNAQATSIANRVAAQAAVMLTQAKADPEYGGAKFDESQRLVDQALIRLRPEGHPRREALLGLLTRTGYINHAEVRAFLADLGSMMAEDTGPAARQTATTQRDTKPLEQRAQESMYGGAKA